MLPRILDRAQRPLDGRQRAGRGYPATVPGRGNAKGKVERQIRRVEDLGVRSSGGGSQQGGAKHRTVGSASTAAVNAFMAPALADFHPRR